ncbi:hypothetical protein A2U01_0061389, partial [Trifolium medium]|nr:hypothetical protein [Trifolium medium]
MFRRQDSVLPPALGAKGAALGASYFAWQVLPLPPVLGAVRSILFIGCSFSDANNWVLGFLKPTFKLGFIENSLGQTLGLEI